VLTCLNIKIVIVIKDKARAEHRHFEVFTPQNATVRNKVEEGARKTEKGKNRKEGNEKREERSQRRERQGRGEGRGRKKRGERSKKRDQESQGMVIQFLGVTSARVPRRKHFICITLRFP
jgi:hypothetical protein